MWQQTVVITFPSRYLVATSPETVYVSFIGTKLAKDVLVDANFLHSPLWQASEPDTVSSPAHFVNLWRQLNGWFQGWDFWKIL